MSDRRPIAVYRQGRFVLVCFGCATDAEAAEMQATIDAGTRKGGG